MLSHLHKKNILNILLCTVLKVKKPSNCRIENDSSQCVSKQIFSYLSEQFVRKGQRDLPSTSFTFLNEMSNRFGYNAMQRPDDMKYL